MKSAINENFVSLANEFGRFIEEAKEKNPYQINLVETIGVDENAHSRILVTTQLTTWGLSTSETRNNKMALVI